MYMREWSLSIYVPYYFNVTYMNLKHVLFT